MDSGQQESNILTVDGLIEALQKLKENKTLKGNEYLVGGNTETDPLLIRGLSLNKVKLVDSMIQSVLFFMKPEDFLDNLKDIKVQGKVGVRIFNFTFENQEKVDDHKQSEK